MHDMHASIKPTSGTCYLRDCALADHKPTVPYSPQARPCKLLPCPHSQAMMCPGQPHLHDHHWLGPRLQAGVLLLQVVTSEGGRQQHQRRGSLASDAGDSQATPAVPQDRQVLRAACSPAARDQCVRCPPSFGWLSDVSLHGSTCL